MHNKRSFKRLSACPQRIIRFGTKTVASPGSPARSIRRRMIVQASFGSFSHSPEVPTSRL